MSSVSNAIEILDFDNAAEMWFTECTLYICFIFIWPLLIRMLYLFCFQSDAPRFKQYDQKKLAIIKRRAEQSRNSRKPSQTTSSTTHSTQSTQSTHSTMPSLGTQQSVPSASVTVASQARKEATTLKSGHNRKPSAFSNGDETPEEFLLQICKINRNLRICFIASLICTAINVTSVMLNHTLIIAGAIDRNCKLSRLPVSANFLQRVALYLFFIFRLHYSFGATQFGIKPVFIWILMAAVVFFGGGAVAYFFLKIIGSDDPCASTLAFSAGAPAVAQDFVFNVLLSVLFLSRLGKAIKSQNKWRNGSTRNLQIAKLKEARKSYKYYYAMFKLACLFIVAGIITIGALVILALFGLGAAMSALDSTCSSYLLFLSFQFNDHYFRKIFCGCLVCQAKILGTEYAKEMELHFVTNAKRKPQNQSSKTWQDSADGECTKTQKNNNMNTINEEEEDTISADPESKGSDGEDIDGDGGKHSNDSSGDKGSVNRTLESMNKVEIVITPDVDDYVEEALEPPMNRVHTGDSEVSNELTMSNGDRVAIFGNNTPIETNINTLEQVDEDIDGEDDGDESEEVP